MAHSINPMLSRARIILKQRHAAPRIQVPERVPPRPADGNIDPAPAGPPAGGFASGAGAAFVVEQIEIPVRAVVGVREGGVG